MLDKRSKKVLWIFGGALLAIIITELVRPQPVDWRDSYTAFDKIPLGSYIFFEEAPLLFNTYLQMVQKDPYEFLSEGTYENNSAYIFINNELFFDKRQTEKILNYVENGSTVFISARSIGGDLADSLKTSNKTSYNILEEEVRPKFYTSTLLQDSISTFKKGVYKSSFISIDTLKSKGLGYYDTSDPNIQDLNYISMEYGKGRFLLHSLPEAFSNYYMLKNNGQYAADVLSYIHAEKIYWDEYLKSGRKVVSSPMRFILNQAPLTWAYYILMTALLIFVIFKGKREQRIVPVIKPLENTSVEFTKTIGDLYFQHKDYSNIIAKKITYFMENIRSKYFLNTSEISEDFIKKLAVKSGNTEDDTRRLMHFIKNLKEKSVHSESDLLNLNKKIEDFRL
jgi:hypothetical protein